jgi:hypothetical protein
VSLLRTSAEGLAALALEGMLGARLAGQMTIAKGQRPSPSEIRSWDGSLPILARDLMDAGLGKVEVLLEMTLPLTSRRVDVVLAGQHPTTRQPSYVVVELKQWSKATAWEGDTILVSIDGSGPRLHPVAQVRGYCDYLVDFTNTLHDHPDQVTGVAYLHNVSAESSIRELDDFPQDDRGRLFHGARRGDWLDHLRSVLDPEVPGAPYADLLVSSGIAPSKQLLTVAADEIRKREQFVLIDEQRLAYERVLHEVNKSRDADSKCVIIVSGGPGSGKSVIALSLVGELARRGRTVLHATGSRSFTQTLRKVAGAKTLFKYFNDFMAAERNGLDVLVLDEAHRIRETSVSRWTKKDLRGDRPQLDELIAAARVPVFLLDEFQVVRPGELGSRSEIRAFAEGLGLRVAEIDLNAQFRCGGSLRYIAWVTGLLGLEGEPFVWDEPDPFEVHVVDSPQEMEHLLLTKAPYKARMTAGYCWPWSNPRDDGGLVADVTIGDWSRPWNLKGDRAVGDAPPAALWASADGGFAQIGCVYTAQGFEYDWNGVILGPDLVWRDDQWVVRREFNKDPDFRNRNRVPDSEFAKLVLNVYKVLLTRGIRGTVIFSVDPETQDHLRDLVRQRAAAAT